MLLAGGCINAQLPHGAAYLGGPSVDRHHELMANGRLNVHEDRLGRQVPVLAEAGNIDDPFCVGSGHLVGWCID